MANPASPTPSHSGSSVAKDQSLNHSRRGSTRKSFNSWDEPWLGSPRTLCARDDDDEDTFTYDKAHLPEWYTSEKLWSSLPESIKKSIIGVQHEGAVVLTGFDRLKKHMQNIEGNRVTHKLDEDELLVKLDTLPSPEMRLARQGSTTGLSIFTDSPNLGSPALSTSQSDSTSPVSPICLTPVEPHEKPERHRGIRSFYVPSEAHDTYYRTELSHLRTEALPRLRHASRKVEADVYETKLAKILAPEEMKEFHSWLTEIKFKIGHLSEKAKRESVAIGLSSTGLGWSAP